MMLTDDYKLAYEKAETEPDTLRQIIKLHTLDVLVGNNRETLNYVDVLYPAIEQLFGVDMCIQALGDKDALRMYYESNFDTDISYDTLRNFFNEARKTCDKIKEEKRYLEACKMVVDKISEVYDKKVSKKM